MQRKLYYFLFSALFLFTYCKNEKSNTSPQSTPSVSEAPKGFYKHLKGTVGEYPITMDLVLVKRNGLDNYSGSYYYDKYQQPISIYGETDSVGNIVLHETNWQEKEIYFTGKIDVSGSFSGNWTDASAKKTMPFLLKDDTSNGALSFDFHTYEDSAKLWKNNPKSPVATFDLQTLLPAKNTEGGIATFLKDRILGGVNSDTLEKSYSNSSIEKVQTTMKDTFFASYIETLKDEKPDSLGEGAVTYNYAESHSTGIIYNENNLLTTGFSTYSYGGGAHGNHATMLKTYDLIAKKTLTINDIFLPKFEKTVNSALAKAVRRQFNMKPNEPLSNRLFDNTIQYSTNFGITKKGILFLFNPYEIAAYAYGEIEVFIPFEDIKTVVNPRFLQ